MAAISDRQIEFSNQNYDISLHIQIIAEDKYESDIGKLVGEFDIHQESSE